MLDTHQLHVFLVAAETLSFTKTARRLHMSQPSVSQHIQTLERHFDKELFTRAGRSIMLTDAGQALLPMAREIVNQSVSIEETMRSLDGEVHGHLLVGCSTTPGKYILPLITLSPDRILVDFESATRMTMSSLGLLFSLTVVVGALVKRRFWCPYCPLGLLMSWYRGWSLLKLKKEDRACTHCRICADVCPMEISEVFLSRGRVDVTFTDCILCLKCIEHCPEDNALRADFLRIPIYRASSQGFFSHPALTPPVPSAAPHTESAHE